MTDYTADYEGEGEVFGPAPREFIQTDYFGQTSRELWPPRRIGARRIPGIVETSRKDSDHPAKFYPLLFGGFAGCRAVLARAESVLAVRRRQGQRDLVCGPSQQAPDNLGLILRSRAARRLAQAQPMHL